MKKLVLFTTFALFTTLVYCQEYRKINIDNMGEMRISSVLDFLKTEYKTDVTFISIYDDFDRKQKLDQDQFDVLKNFVSNSNTFNLITRKNANNLTVNELMNDNNIYQRRISKSLRNIAICTSITTTTIMAGILAGIIYTATTIK